MFTLNIDALSEGEARALLRLMADELVYAASVLLVRERGKAAAAGQVPAMLSAAPEAASGAAEDTGGERDAVVAELVPQDKKPPQVRRRRATAKTDTAAPVAQPQAEAPKPDPLATGPMGVVERQAAAKTEAPAPATDIQQAAQAFVAKNGTPALVAKLQAFGARRVSEVPAEKVAVFIAALAV